MDFGLDSLLCSNNGGSFALDSATAEIHKQKCYGFGFLKQERERAVNEDELMREFKMAKTTSSTEAMLRFPLQRSSNGGSEAHQQMLNFSSPNSLPLSSPFYHHSSSAFGRNSSGYGYGGSMQGMRGPFTPSQWMELEHQALIYKYLSANLPIPSYLLNPIRKAFESASFSSSTLSSNPLGGGGGGWGGFQLGFANTDPEPGRCRRTDGKKWRCSRDAVADQKYCERHINRGRHRSRKPVEAHSAAAKLTPIPSSTSVQPSATSSTAYLSGIPTTSRVDPKDQAAFQESSFGLVCSDSLLNPLNRSSSLINCKTYDHKPDHHHPLRQFMDDWPKTQLSISIPMAVASGFTSSTSSPTNEKPTSPPPRLSGELEMGLGVGSQRRAKWVPISWEPSMGGPLGEVLQTTSDCKNTQQQPLNLIDRWDNNSPGMASSPTGVLQRGAFASLSNSSATSSPRAESSKNGGINAGPMNP